MRRGLIVAGTHSGCGKTTACLALIRHFRECGLDVAPFKAGPDFLDPMHLAASAGQPAWNLDTWMMGEAECRRVLAEANAGSEMAIVEGVMGLFDGAAGVGGPGSTVHLASSLGLPLLLVVDASGMAGTLAPIVEGLVGEARRQGAEVAGILATRIGSRSHARMLADVLASRALPPLVAWLETSGESLKERHLGLVMPEGRQPSIPQLHSMADLSAKAGPIEPAGAYESGGLLDGRRIAVARDAAFSFIYPGNLDWLVREGASLSFFSPLAGEGVPPGADALWLPGGYPELHGEELSRSSSLASIRDFAESGRAVLAECGGMMVLGAAIEDASGSIWPMAGLRPHRYRLSDRPVEIGYRRARSGLRGHAFHYACRIDELADSPAFDVERGDAGWRHKGVRASWNHWYFPSSPKTAPGLFQ